jgi:hypothetical protein
MPAALARTTAASPRSTTTISTAARRGPVVAAARAPAATTNATTNARNRTTTTTRATSSSSSAPPPNPARQLLTGLASAIYKMQAPKEVDPRLAASPLWTALEKLDEQGVRAALKSGASPDEPNPITKETPLVMIAKRGGHYKYPPAGIPTALIDGGADLEVKDPETGNTAFELSLLRGWQNVGYLLLDRGAKTSGVDAALKAKITCPDCKRLVAEKGL